MSEEVVVYELRGNIAIVRINRPKQMNAVNPEVVVRLARLWKQINADDAVRVVILTGTGDKTFSAGAGASSRASPAS